ncbi:MAG: O-antigen ligase family protein [candidate division WOR-3 bacterium]
MTSGAGTTSAVTVSRRPLVCFVALELICTAGFVVFVALGRQSLALVWLLGPLQLLAWFVLMGNPYWLLMFFNALVMLTPMELLPRYYLLFGLFPGTALLLAFLALTRFLRPNEPPASGPGRLNLILPAVLFTWIALAAVHALQTWGWKGWATANMLFATTLGLAAVVIGWFYATIPRNVGQIRRLVYVLIGGTVVAALAVYVLPPPQGEGGLLGGKVIITPFGEASLNVFGTVLAAMAAMLVGLLVFEERAAARLLQLLTLLLFVVTLVFTKSRGAWFGFGVALLYVLLISRSRRLLVVLAVASAIVLSVDVLRHFVLVRTSETTARDSSLMGRMVLWFYGWKVAKANWLWGVGMDYFRAIKHSYGFPSPYDIVSLRYHTHNLFLEVLANLGVVGLAAFVAMLVGSLRRLLVKHIRLDSEVRGLALGTGAALIAFVMHGLWDAVIWQYGALMLLAVLIGLATSVHRVVSVRKAKQSQISVVP